MTKISAIDLLGFHLGGRDGSDICAIVYQFGQKHQRIKVYPIGNGPLARS